MNTMHLSKSLIAATVLALPIGLPSARAEGGEASRRMDAVRCEAPLHDASLLKIGDAAPVSGLIVAADAGARVVSNVRVREISGLCAGLVTDSLPGLVVLGHGAVYSIVEGIAAARWTRADEVLAAKRSAPAAKWRGMTFVQATEIGVGPASRRRTFIGLWSSADGSMVGTYSDEAGSLSEVRPIAISAVRLLSISYVPAPDTSAGVVTAIDGSSARPRIVIFELG